MLSKLHETKSIATGWDFVHYFGVIIYPTTSIKDEIVIPNNIWISETK